MKIRQSQTRNKSFYTEINLKEMMITVELSKRESREQWSTLRKVQKISTKSIGQRFLINLI